MPDRAPRIAGAGLLALDVVMCGDEKPDALTFAGGTCGNVLSILSYLRWASTPIGFVGDDPAGKRILADLATVGVRAGHLIKDAGWTTPVFVQRLQRDDEGLPRHTFASASRCPNCGQLLAGKGTPSSEGATPIRRFKAPQKVDVFFMDRLSDDILSLAESAKAHGALVFYEPSAKSDIRHWDAAFTLIDIVKYSVDRFEKEELAPFVTQKPRNGLWEVQTLGARGLKYRRHERGPRIAPRWMESPAIAATRVVDTCGAGDWCTAGLLHGLIAFSKNHGTVPFADAIRLGQVLAAWACAYVGARGAMYCNDSTATWTAVNALVESRTLDLSQLPTAAHSTPSSLAGSASCAAGLCAES